MCPSSWDRLKAVPYFLLSVLYTASTNMSVVHGPLVAP
jgi:hypothetical protein